MSDDSDGFDDDITHRLQAWSAGSRASLDEVIQLLEGELKHIAEVQMRGEDSGSTFTPTVLLNEAYLKFVQQRRATWQNRSQFLAVAATVMRRILVDHHRHLIASKRPPKRLRVTLAPDIGAAADGAVDFLVLHDALEHLGRQDPALAKLVELRWFAGLELNEIAEAAGISRAAVNRRLRLARAWLRRELEASDKTAKI